MPALPAGQAATDRPVRLQALIDLDGMAQQIVYIGRPAGAERRRDRRRPRLDGRTGAAQRRADHRAGHVPGEVRTAVNRIADAAPPPAEAQHPRVHAHGAGRGRRARVASICGGGASASSRPPNTRATNLAVVLAEYIRGSFASADAALRQLQIHGKRIGGPSAPRDDWEPILASAKAALPESGSLLGHRRHRAPSSTRRSRAIVGQSRSDNYVFKQLAAATGDELVIDRPYPTLTTPPAVRPAGRRAG